MQRIASFEKVSYEQFEKDVMKYIKSPILPDELHKIYDDIELPTRATKGF